jgi:mRNA interferase MazF
MLNPGDVVIVDFPTRRGIKKRPAVVISTSLYHTHRPDVIVALLTTQVAKAIGPTDYVLQDWMAAGLHQPSAFRSYIVTLDDGRLPSVGQLSSRDWHAIQTCMNSAIAITP